MTDIDIIRETLADVTDPDLGGDVLSAGLVTDASLDGGTVTLDVELAGLAPETSEEVVERMRGALLERPGVEQVRVEGETPESEQQTVGLPADRVIAVASAKGGVGKSTVATALARGLAERGEDVGLFDADIHGPNVPALVDAEGPVVATEDGHAAPVEATGLSVMSIGLLDNDAPIAWRGAMAHEALLDLLGDTAWGDLDTLVLDLPPGTGDIVLTTLQDIPVDGVVLVSTPYPTALDDTDRSATLFREKAVPILGAVVNMAGFTCPSCGDEHALFGDDATAETDVPVLAELPFDESMQDPTEDLPSGVDGLVASVSERADEVGFDLPENPLNVAGVPAGVRVELVTEELAALDAGDELTVVTDQEPTALLAAVGAEPDGHGECGCGHGNGEERSGSSAVADVEVHQVGREEWAIRVEKGEAASADECVAD